jgi:hypothetical protein
MVIYWLINLQQKYNFEPKNVTFERSKPTLLGYSIVIFDTDFDFLNRGKVIIAYSIRG